MKRKGKSASGPNKKPNQGQSDGLAGGQSGGLAGGLSGNRVTGGTQTTGTPPPRPIQITAGDTPVIDNSPLTKPKKTASFLAPPITTTSTDPGELVQSLAAELMAESDEGSGTFEVAQVMSALVKTAATQQMKQIPTDQLVLMAKIVRGKQVHDIEDPDDRITTLISGVRDFLVERRPAVAAYVLRGGKQQAGEKVSAQQQATDTAAWLSKVMPILTDDGFNDGQQLIRMRDSIDKLLAAIAGGKAKAEWPELRGYIFQINHTMAAHSRYQLKNVESGYIAPESDNLRFVDSVELVFPPGEQDPSLCFCEYKGYGTEQNPTPEFMSSFQGQLDDYVSELLASDQPLHLRYAFPGAAPDWVHAKLRGAAEQLGAKGRRLFLVEGKSLRTVGKEKELFTKSNKPPKPPQSTTPDSDVVTNTDEAATVRSPVMRTLSAPGVVVKGKTASGGKNQKKVKEKEKPVPVKGQLTSYFQVVRTPTKAATGGARPGSSTNPDTKPL
ncbi:hypothetical protein HII36_50875 [Nonomuraea sp. NN258]|uniref:hypothetical protein n=1 Tax=Nonomuraea antri TaxID=2730852 RepID=UPI0015696094|nr:hypothetical protein [Nonomuraea antri]NRQ40075.1 hypothetical protein [Nonomuraea antri]